MFYYQILIYACISSTLICNVLGTILNTVIVSSTEHKMPLFPYSNRIGGGRMIEKPRRRLKPKSAIKPEINIRQKRSDPSSDTTYLEPLSDAILEAAGLSQESLPLDRYPKRSRNRVSEGF